MSPENGPSGAEASVGGPTTGRGASAEAAFAPGAGWSLVEIVSWLASEGRHIADPAAFTGALCARLHAAGAPLARMRLSFRTLHPQVRAMGYTWTPGAEVDVYPVPYEIELSDAFVGSPMQHVIDTGTPFRRRLDALDPARDHPVLFEFAETHGTDYLAVPLTFAGNTSGGVITVVTDRPGGFDDRDVAAYATLMDFLAPLLEAASMRHTARALLDTYVGPRTGERVLNGRIRRGDGETIHAAMWFSDVRDFTPLTESLPPAALLATLNAYFETVAAAVTARGGEILRFIGDAMLIVFPADARGGVRGACTDAADAAIDAFNGLAALNHRRRRAGEPPIRFGVGLHVGEAVYGNVGAPNRLDFTVMGPAVNRTARLESLTKTVGTPLLLSREFADALGRPVRSRGIHPMKGVAEPQEVYSLDEFEDSLD